jgi:hypothetical protein
MDGRFASERRILLSRRCPRSVVNAHGGEPDEPPVLVVEDATASAS